MKDPNTPILNLLRHEDESNKALAFQLCVGLKGKYSKEVALELQQYPIACVIYGVEPGFVEGLEELETEGMNGEEVPPEIMRMKKLKRLDLGENALKELPKEFDELVKLEALLLYNNFFQLFPLVVTRLPALKVLDLSDNELETLPTELDKLTRLEVLNLSNNQFKTLPVVIPELTSLEQLDLSDNELETLPATLAKLTRLETLALEGNRFEAVPHVLFQLKKLKELDLSNYEFTELPADVCQFSNLRTLNLKYNKLEQLPKGLSLPKLEELILDHNLLLNDSFRAFAGMKSLKKLSLAHVGNMAATPEDIPALPYLEELYLSYTSLAKVPQGFALFKNLKILSLPKNQIEEFPIDLLLQLPHLEFLDLSDNQITQIPESPHKFPNIKSIRVRNNPGAWHDLAKGMMKLCPNMKLGHFYYNKITEGRFFG